MAFSTKIQGEVTSMKEIESDRHEAAPDIEREVSVQEIIRNQIVQDLAGTIDKLGNACSDIHLCTNRPPVARVNGELQELSFMPPLSECAINKLVEALALHKSVHDLVVSGAMDVSLSVQYPQGKEIRFRGNIFKDRNGTSLAIRIIRDTIPTMQELRLPPSVQKLKDLPYGLVVICGPTGSGKSTTLASLIEAINEEHAKRIITIEDPVEYIHPWRRSVISQREVGADCLNFSEGLRSALRQDPDIILVGEMRDAQTIATALAAAETGHLVLTTLHTATTVEAVDRIVQYFPAESHLQIRNEIATSFRAFVAQKLFKTKKGTRAAAFEVLLHSDATASLIRQGLNYQLPSYMLAAQGMMKMEDSIKSLRNLRLID